MTDILTGTVKEVVACLSAEPLTAAEARALHAEEVASGRGPDKTGRRGVKNALEEKFGQAGLEDASLGLARGPSVEVDAAPEPAPTPTPAAPVPSSMPWEKKKWNGEDLYVCRTCGRDSFDVTEIYEHTKRHHPRAG